MKGDDKVKLTPRLLEELNRRVAAGDFPTVTDAVEACVRYYLERHGEKAWKSYLNEEIEAGLNESA